MDNKNNQTENNPTSNLPGGDNQNHSRQKLFWIGGIIVLAILAIVGGVLFMVFSHNTCEKDVGIMVNKLCMPKEKLFKIKAGSSLAEVRKNLGHALHHEFTILYENEEYSLVGCLVNAGQADSNFNQWMLFRNDILVNFLDWVPYEMEEIPYEGTTWRRPKPWNIEDMSRIKKVLSAPRKTLNEVNVYSDYTQSDERVKGEPAKIMLPFLLYARTMCGKIKRDYQINWKLLGRYDGCLVKIGMPIKEVDKLYGKPLQKFSTKDEYMVRIYGDTRHLGIDPQYKFSDIAVVFNKEGKAIKVLSHTFFNEKWLSAATQE
ncbi:MAG TPA: hypothetical protein ENL06_02250 [Candidatus Portnoybacteria bacterium]|nr:hypothetical protein [Candidatus Portnoybacteria bacterium]